MTTLVYRTKPRPYQVPVLKRMVSQRGGGLQVPMRWGKSWIALNWAGALYHLEKVRRVIVITTPSGIGVWEDQIAQHCPVPYEILTHHGERLKLHGVQNRLVFMLVDYPNVYRRARWNDESAHEWIPVANEVLVKFDAQAIVVDESHHIGNSTAEQTKQIIALSRSVRYRLFMTGTMFHRKPFFIFGQMLFYDEGARLGNSFSHFKEKIATFRDKEHYVVSRYKNLKWMVNQVKDVVHIEESVPTQPPVNNVIHFDLGGNHAIVYGDFARDRVIEVDGEVLTAELILTLHLRLLMIAGGYVKIDGKYKQVGTSKLDMARDRLTEYWEQGIEKAVVGCRFVPELGGVARIGKKLGYQVKLLHGAVPKSERTERIRFFKETDKPCLFISQVQTGAEAIDLSAADTMMFYSLPSSFLMFDQFRSRIAKFEEQRTLMYDFLIARNTHDQVAYDAMMLSQDVAQLLTKDPERVQEITAKFFTKR